MPDEHKARARPIDHAINFAEINCGEPFAVTVAENRIDEAQAGLNAQGVKLPQETVRLAVLFPKRRRKRQIELSIPCLH